MTLFAFGNLLRRVSDIRLIVAGSVLLTLSLIIAARISSVLLLQATSIGLGLSVGIYSIVVYARSAKLVGEASILSGIFTTTAGLGLSGIPVASGYIASICSAQVALLCFVPVLLVAGWFLGTQRVTSQPLISCATTAAKSKQLEHANVRVATAPPVDVGRTRLQ